MNYPLPNNRKLVVNQEECAESPREWDNVCKMIFIGNHSHLGDKHDFHSKYESFEAHQEAIEKELDVAFIAPVYAYIHSGMTISLSPFSCPWDSGKLGWVVITKQALRENYGVKRITKALIEKAMVHVKCEVETLDQYIRGEVYYFNIEDEDGDVEDSCGGFYGDDIKENGILDHIGEEDRKFLESTL